MHNLGMLFYYVWSKGKPWTGESDRKIIEKNIQVGKKDRGD